MSYMRNSISRWRLRSGRGIVAISYKPPVSMETNLPLIAVVGDDPMATMSIRMIVGDLCRIEHHARDDDESADDDERDRPDLILVAMNESPLDVPGPANSALTTDEPVFYVSTSDACTSDDGIALQDCLATPSRPSEFRATIEARLGRRIGLACAGHRF